MSSGIIGSALDDLLIARQSLPGASHLFEQIGAIVMCVRIVAIELQRPVICGECFDVPLEGNQYAALVQGCRSGGGCDAQSTVDACQGLLELAALHGDDGQ